MIWEDKNKIGIDSIERQLLHFRGLTFPKH